MRKDIRKNFRGETAARNAWWAFAGLLTLAFIAITLREVPSMRREIRLMRM